MSEKAVLIVDDEKHWLDEITRELKRRLKGRYKFIRRQRADDAIQDLRENTHISCIIADWHMMDPDDPDKTQYLTTDQFLREIRKVRPSTYVFLLTVERTAPDTEDALYDDFWFKGDRDYDRLADAVTREMHKLEEVPFFHALDHYVTSVCDAWHTPGHSGGDSFKESSIKTLRDFYKFFGDKYFRADLSVSVNRLDSLLEPKGKIAEALELTAKTFNSRRSYFCTNGTSTANKIVMQALLNPGDVVLMDRNCHKSVHYGVALCDAIPVYLEPSLNEKYGLTGPVPKVTIKKEILRLKANRRSAKLLILTNCTYDGMVYDMPEIVKTAHDHDVKVLVDEAWFGYAYFSALRRCSAMLSQADYATQSTHKVLSAFSQASMIHVRDEDFNEHREHRFHESFMMHTSTSPQYTMIASLDCARLQMYLEGEKLMGKVWKIAAKLRNDVNKLGYFKVLDDAELIPYDVSSDGVAADPSKLTISFEESGYSRNELLAELASSHIEIEKSTLNSITVLVTPGVALTGGKPERLVKVLRRLSSDLGGYEGTPLPPFPKKIAQPRYLPRDVMVADTVWLSLPEISNADAISAGMIVPYPPGIPVVLPGQVWDQVSAEYVGELFRKGVEVHGVSHHGKVPVLTEKSKNSKLMRLVPPEVLSDE